MVYLVDTIQVAPKDTDRYLKLLQDVGIPAMTKAGCTLVSCWTTSKDIGEDVSVQTVYSFKDHVEWNDIRKNMVLSPQWHEFADGAAKVRKGGMRRFYYPPAFSPMR